MAEPEDEVPSILLPCTICNRTFKPESLEKHAKVCEKNAAKKRKTFDSSKQRIQGTELAEYLPVVPKKVEKSPVKKPQSQWKEKHLEFVRAIRQARGVQSPGRRSLSAIEQSRPVNHEQCPHCERNFGPKAFDRHIEWCKEQKSRIPSSPLTPANILAKERLEARTKYRAPLSKSKRSIMREKYSPTARTGIREPSPMGSRGAVNCSTVSISSSSSNQTVKTIAARTTGSAPSSQRSSARESVSSPSCSLQRNVTPRSSTQRRSSSPTKRPSLVRKDSAGGRGQTSTPAQKKKATQEGLENLFSSSCNITRLNPSKTNSKQVPVGNAARNKNKKNEVKSTRSPMHVNSNTSPHQSKKGNIAGKHEKKTNEAPDISPKDKTRTKQKQLVKPISSYEGSQVSQGAETSNEFLADALSTTDTALILNKTPRKQKSCPKAKKISPNKCENSKNDIVSTKKDKISPQKDFTKMLLASPKVSPKKDKSPKKVNQIMKNVSIRSPFNKINEICVNEDQMDITVSSCQIYASKHNLVTWQELAVGTEKSKPTVMTNLNQTYTITEGAEILKLDLPVSSCSNSPVPCSPRQRSGSESLEQLSSDSLADDEKESVVSTRMSSSENLIVPIHDASEPIVENTVEENSSCAGIWNIAAQDLLKEVKDVRSCSVDSQIFYEGLDRTCLYSTPVKCELHNSFNCSENESLYFDNCKRVEDRLPEEISDRIKQQMRKKDIKLHSIIKHDILMCRSMLLQTWRGDFFLKEKWLAAKRKLSHQRKVQSPNIKKSKECVLQGQPVAKRRKLKDTVIDWSLTVVDPFLFCAIERKSPFFFHSGELEHKKCERFSKSEQNLTPKSDFDHLKRMSANNNKHENKSSCQRRRKYIRCKNSVGKSKSQETRIIHSETKSCISTDSLEHEKACLMGKDRDDTVTIEFVGSLNSETDISCYNSYSEERCNLVSAHKSSLTRELTQQSKTDICSNGQIRIADITCVDTDKEKTHDSIKTHSFSLIKSETRALQSGKTDGNIEIHYEPSPRKHKRPQRKLKFPDISGNVGASLDKNVTGGVGINYSNSVPEERYKINEENGHSEISLQKMNTQIYELEDCKYGSIQDKLFLPDINKHCSSRSEIGIRKQDKPSFWENQSKGRQSHSNSTSDISSERSIYSRNPNAKKLPPLYHSSSHRRGRFARLKTQNFTPNMPNVALLLNSTITTEEAYDPYLSAERQMLELLSGDWPAATEIKNEQEQKEERIEKPEPSPPSSPPNELRTSPTSAFTKYSPTKPRPDSCETKPASATSFHDTEDVDHQPVRPESRKKLNHISKIPIEDEHDGQINRRSITSKVSGDSAYSSLNRKSPLADVQSERLDTDLHCLSSSGSESSLPPLCSVQVEGKSPTPLLESNAPKMSKFCHECGFKYPLTLAKFCCECGVKRLFV